jgi:hypothetical protein
MFLSLQEVTGYQTDFHQNIVCYIYDKIRRDSSSNTWDAQNGVFQEAIF